MTPLKDDAKHALLEPAVDLRLDEVCKLLNVNEPVAVLVELLGDTWRADLAPKETVPAALELQYCFVPANVRDAYLTYIVRGVIAAGDFVVWVPLASSDCSGAVSSSTSGATPPACADSCALPAPKRMRPRWSWNDLACAIFLVAPSTAALLPSCSQSAASKASFCSRRPHSRRGSAREAHGAVLVDKRSLVPVAAVSNIRAVRRTTVPNH